MRTTPLTSNHRSRQEPDARLIRGRRRGDLVAIVVNSVAGAGIFALPSRVYALAGTYSLAAYRVAAVVFPNIVKLGFKPADIKLMLISHAHYDHMETMPITGDPNYNTRPEDPLNSYKALRAMNPGRIERAGAMTHKSAASGTQKSPRFEETHTCEHCQRSSS